MCVCVREREIMCMFARVCVRGWETEGKFVCVLCVCVCVCSFCEGERECVCAAIFTVNNYEFSFWPFLDNLLFGWWTISINGKR